MHLGTSFSFGCICQTCVKHNNNLDLQNERDNKNVSCMIDEYMRKRGRERERNVSEVVNTKKITKDNNYYVACVS